MNGGRRGPWLSGLLVALAGAVWMIGRCVVAVVVGVSGLLSPGYPVDAPPPAWVGAPAVPATAPAAGPAASPAVSGVPR